MLAHTFYFFTGGVTLSGPRSLSRRNSYTFFFVVKPSIGPNLDHTYNVIDPPFRNYFANPFGEQVLFTHFPRNLTK